MTNLDSPRVSVIITTYDRASLLPCAVNSVLSQVFKDMVRRRVSAIGIYWKAVTTAGICSRLAVRATVHFLKVYLWYATPLSRIRGGTIKFRNYLKAALRGRERNR